MVDRPSQSSLSLDEASIPNGLHCVDSGSIPSGSCMHMMHIPRGRRGRRGSSIQYLTVTAPFFRPVFTKATPIALRHSHTTIAIVFCPSAQINPWTWKSVHSFESPLRSSHTSRHQYHQNERPSLATPRGCRPGPSSSGPLSKPPARSLSSAPGYHSTSLPTSKKNTC